MGLTLRERERDSNNVQSAWLALFEGFNLHLKELPIVGYP